MNTHKKGDIGELAIAAECVRRGYAVAFPFGHNTRYDMIVDKNGVLLRMQVKTTESDGKVVSVHLYSNGTSDGTFDPKRYSDDIDIIGVYDLCTSGCWFLTRDVFANRSSVTLRLVETTNNQCKRVRWANDYTEL